MEIETVIPRLREILREYQDVGQDLDVDSITPDTKPLADIKGFDSHFIPEIVRRLARELGNPLPKGTRVRNIFVERGRKLTVREIARQVHREVCPQGVQGMSDADRAEETHRGAVA